MTEKRNIALKRPNPPGERIARRQGGLKGGKARAEKLSPERRRESALFLESTTLLFRGSLSISRKACCLSGLPRCHSHRAGQAY